MRTYKLNAKNQRGMSAIGVVVGLFIIGFTLTCVLKIAPVYYDNSLVRDVLKVLGENAQFNDMSKDDIVSKLISSFDINSIRGTPTKHIKVLRRDDGWLVNIDYEERIPFWGNLDVVITFENQLNGAKPDDCCEKKIADVPEE